ncbi:type II toxin-antitoxin system MqsA family antitoxin [Acidobacteria bacterium AH-259-L09]|nr:type II toxin-antitoxin system MqsA family antitoxin [Acidobacteria bacterium AH-259-L09]
MKQIKKCAECGGTLEKKTITHTQPWGKELYWFENVPALVCRQCGRAWLSAEVSQMIDEIIQKQPKPRKYQKVPVFSFPDLAKA